MNPCRTRRNPTKKRRERLIFGRTIASKAIVPAGIRQEFPVFMLLLFLTGSFCLPTTATGLGDPAAEGGFGLGGPVLLKPEKTGTKEPNESGIRDGKVLVSNRTSRTIRFKSRYTIDEEDKRSNYTTGKTYTLAPQKSLLIHFGTRPTAIKSYGYTILPGGSRPDRHFVNRATWEEKPDRRLTVVLTERHTESLESTLDRLSDISRKRSVKMEDCPKCEGRGVSEFLHKCRHCNGTKRTPYYPDKDLKITGIRLKRSYNNPQEALVVYEKGVLPEGGESMKGFLRQLDERVVQFIWPRNHPSDGQPLQLKSEKIREIKTTDGVYTFNHGTKKFDFNGLRRPFSDSGSLGEAFNGILDIKEAWDTLPEPVQQKIKSGGRMTLEYLGSVANSYELEEGIKKCTPCRGRGTDFLGIKCIHCRGIGVVQYERLIPRR